MTTIRTNTRDCFFLIFFSIHPSRFPYTIVSGSRLSVSYLTAVVDSFDLFLSAVATTTTTTTECVYSNTMNIDRGRACKTIFTVFDVVLTFVNFYLNIQIDRFEDTAMRLPDRLGTDRVRTGSTRFERLQILKNVDFFTTKNKILFHRYVNEWVFKNATNKLPYRYGIVRIEPKKKTLLSKRAPSDVSISFILRLVFPAYVDDAFFLSISNRRNRTVRSVLNGIRGSTKSAMFRLYDLEISSWRGIEMRVYYSRVKREVVLGGDFQTRFWIV